MSKTKGSWSLKALVQALVLLLLSFLILMNIAQKALAAAVFFFLNASVQPFSPVGLLPIATTKATTGVVLLLYYY